jgi:beta-lactamase class A
MASTFKVAVAGTVLALADRGAISLDQMVPIAADRMIESEGLAENFVHPGLSVSIHNLLELMLTRSDNTATDYLVDVAGGPQAVTAWAHARGASEMRIDGGTDAIIRRFYGMGPGPFATALKQQMAADPELEARSLRPNAAFDADPRDTTSPAAMATLLQHIFEGHALGATSTTTIKDIMERCKTGDHRLRGRLPSGSLVYDKTGTIGGSVNDVGVIGLPDNKGMIVVAVYIAGSDAGYDVRERAIADIGRSVRDFYMFSP